jgi:hypothetical protein
MVNFSCRGPWRDKANASLADYGLGQTCGGTPASGPAASGPRATTVRNKPNLVPLGQGQAPDGRKMRNKPNLARPGRGRRPGGRTVRNEPNLVAVQGPGGRNTQNEPNFGGTSHRSWSEDLLRGGWAGRLFRRRPVGNIDPRP